MKSKATRSMKAILAVILSVSIVLSCVVGGFIMFRQPEQTVTDLTTAQPVQEGEDGAAGGKKEPHAYISPNVTMLQNEEAAAVNAAITTLKTTSAGVYLTVKEGTKLDQLGVGDVFFLDGSESTPIGEPYFGKIASTKIVNGDTQLLLETPTLDEVFDSVSFDTGSLFNENVEATFTGLEGVTVSAGGTLVGIQNAGFSNANTPAVTPLAASADQPKISTLDSTAKVVTDGYSTYVETVSDKRWAFNPAERLELKLEVDLLKAFKKLSGDTSVEPYEEGSNATRVYITAKGYAYHRETCFHLKSSKTVQNITLSEAADGERTPCKHCKPPILSAASSEHSLKLTGAVGIENLHCDAYLDWDILGGKGVENLWIDITGTAFAEVNVTGSAEFKLGGKETEWSDPTGSIKVQGLKEKLFPIGFINLTQSFAVVPAVGGQETVRTSVKAMPVSILIMVYVDIQGNLTFSLAAEAKVTRDFNFNYHLVENGKVDLLPQLVAEEPSVTWSIEAGVEGDLDVHCGLSALVYVFNINVVDVALLKIGSEAQGKLAVTVSNETIEGTEPWCEASFYARKYIKILDVKLNIKCSAELFWGIVSFAGEADWKWTMLDFTLASFGAKLPTRYSPGVMSYSHVTAQDADAIYYKDEDGRLIREKDKYKTILYDEDFFIICGIDESYLYILKQKDGGSFAMYRLAKENQTAKEVISSVSSVLYCDEENIYYLDGFDNTVIRKFRRSDETAVSFADFGHAVQVMVKQDYGLYVVTRDEDEFSWFFGADNYHYLLDAAGNILCDYGTKPAVADLCLYDCGNFNEAARITEGGVLRQTAAAIYWLSDDKTQYVEAEGVSGWNQKKNVGIFVTRDNNVENEADHKIYLYEAEHGMVIPVTDVQSDQAFFTLTQSQTGDWYFFDQTETEMILYRMNESFTDKELVKAFSLEEVPYNLTDCGMSMIGNCLYFYSIQDDKVCTVIKRYDLY